MTIRERLYTKLGGGVGWVAHVIIVSLGTSLGLGLGLGLGGLDLGIGLDNIIYS